MRHVKPTRYSRETEASASANVFEEPGTIIFPHGSFLLRLCVGRTGPHALILRSVSLDTVKRLRGCRGILGRVECGELESAVLCVVAKKEDEA
jgi:hypothetical protein